ncbi:MAG: SDR family oxidoreductase [Thaumarchaeota archaeon]|nr:MAG: SDR family oxidoreductase [Nitrososphaerota archaeon]
MTPDLDGKTCLVTGATSGIGKETAIGLAKKGATVVLVGRNRDRCESTVKEIKAKINGATENKLSFYIADLSSRTSIHQLAKEYANDHQRLDVLVNNAGVFLAKRTTAIDGIEYTFAVNHLAPFLLTNLLIDILKASSPSRIITTSSIAHEGARIDFDDIEFEKRPYRGIKAYGQSKLANILFTKELARRLEGSGVTANCFHPGAVRTNLLDNNPWYYQLIWAAAGVFFLSPEKGADTAIYLASSKHVEGITGKYFGKRKQVESSTEANDEKVAIRLWKISEKLTGVAENGKEAFSPFS